MLLLLLAGVVRAFAVRDLINDQERAHLRQDVRRRGAHAARIGVEAVRGQLGVEAAIELAQHLGQFLFVLAEQQRLQRLGDVGVAEGLQERAGQAGRADRIGVGRRAERGGQRFEAQVQHFQRTLVAATDGFGQALPGEVELEFVLAHQPHRHPGLAQVTAAAEIVEAARDHFAEAHDEAGTALAQRQHRHQVLALRAAAADAQVVVQLVLDRPIETARHRAELLDGDALEFIEQARGIGCRHGGQAGRMCRHDIPHVPLTYCGKKRRKREHSGTMVAVHIQQRNL